MRIAIVEDERKLAKTLAEGLGDEGYDVDLYGDAESFLTPDAARPPADLLVLDLGLPKMGGLELSRTLRAAHVLLPILILTAHDTIEDKVQALDSGADDFLAKPFNFEELMARIRALMRRASLQEMKQLTCNDLVIDTRARRVSRGDEELLLTPTEYDLLMLLLENRGRALSREEISGTLWNVRDIALSNIVDVHISNLRKKLDSEHATKYISTVRGLGYSAAA